MRLEEALRRSAAASPGVAAAEADLRAVQARGEREALPTPYVVGADVENVLGTGNFSGFESAELTARLGRVIETGGKREARRGIAEAQAAESRHAVALARGDLSAKTTARFYEVLVDQRRLAAAEERVRLAARTRAEVARWVQAARNPETDLHAADLVVADAELAREHAEHELAAAKVTLASSWGTLTPDFDQVEGDLDTLPDAPGLEDFSRRLPASTRQRTAALQADTAAARRRLAEADAKPDLNVSLGVRRFEAFGDQGLVASLSVPLGTRTRSRLAVAEADAERAAALARADAGLADAGQVLFETYQELLHARTEHRSVTDTMLPTATRAAAFARRGFEAGRFSAAVLAQAEKTLFELRARQVEAAARYHALLAELERMTATPSMDAAR